MIIRSYNNRYITLNKDKYVNSNEFYRKLWKYKYNITVNESSKSSSIKDLICYLKTDDEFENNNSNNNIQLRRKNKKKN